MLDNIRFGFKSSENNDQNKNMLTIWKRENRLFQIDSLSVLVALHTRLFQKHSKELYTRSNSHFQYTKIMKTEMTYAYDFTFVRPVIEALGFNLHIKNITFNERYFALIIYIFQF